MQYKVGQKVKAIRQAAIGHFALEVGKTYTIKGVHQTLDGKVYLMFNEPTPKCHPPFSDYYPGGYGSFSDNLVSFASVGRNLPEWF